MTGHGQVMGKRIQEEFCNLLAHFQPPVPLWGFESGFLHFCLFISLFVCWLVCWLGLLVCVCVFDVLGYVRFWGVLFVSIEGFRAPNLTFFVICVLVSSLFRVRRAFGRPHLT